MQKSALPSDPSQLREVLNLHMRQYPNERKRRAAASVLKVLNRVTSVVLGPGSLLELGFQPLLDSGLLVHRGHGEYSLANDLLKQSLDELDFNEFGFFQHHAG